MNQSTHYATSVVDDLIKAGVVDVGDKAKAVRIIRRRTKPLLDTTEKVAKAGGPLGMLADLALLAAQEETR